MRGINVLNNRMRRVATIAPVAALLVLACGNRADHGQEGWGPSPVPVPEWLQSDTRYIEEVLEADTVLIHPKPEAPVYRIDSVHRDRAGRYILTVRRGSACGVYLFTPTGDFVRRIGSRGEGPGEYVRPWCATTDSLNNDIVIYDPILLRVSVFDSLGVFVRSFQVDLPAGGIGGSVVPGPPGVIVVADQFAGYPAIPHTAWSYSLNGRLIAKFGQLSPETKKVRDRWLLVMEGPNLVYLGRRYYENDYASYRIRVYDERGRKIDEFGVPPPSWRSYADADFSLLPAPGGAMTPERMKKLDRFRLQEGVKSSVVRSLQPLGKYHLLQTILYLEANPMASKARYVFMIYDIRGNLVKGPLVFRHPPRSRPDAMQFFLFGMPRDLFVVEVPVEPVRPIRLVCLHVPDS